MDLLQRNFEMKSVSDKFWAIEDVIHLVNYILMQYITVTILVHYLANTFTLFMTLLPSILSVNLFVSFPVVCWTFTLLFSYIASHTGLLNFLVTWRHSLLSEISCTFRRMRTCSGTS
jgi:hypothetical protein